MQQGSCRNKEEKITNLHYYNGMIEPKGNIPKTLQ